MITLLSPFVEILKDLYQNGETNNKVIAPVASLDAPALASAQNIMQFNGFYGCSNCENPGQTCLTGSGHNHVYRYINSPLRTKVNMIQQAYQGRNEGIV